MDYNPHWFTVAEFAREKHVTLGYIYILLQGGKLQGAKKVAKTWRIPKIAQLPSEARASKARRL